MLWPIKIIWSCLMLFFFEKQVRNSAKKFPTYWDLWTALRTSVWVWVKVIQSTIQAFHVVWVRNTSAKFSVHAVFRLINHPWIMKTVGCWGFMTSMSTIWSSSDVTLINFLSFLRNWSKSYTKCLTSFPRQRKLPVFT